MRPSVHLPVAVAVLASTLAAFPAFTSAATLPITGNVAYPALSPDGKRLAFARRTAAGWRIFVGRADGSNARQVSNGPGHDVEPAWRSDSGLLAFASNRKGNYDIWAVKPDGGGLRQLTSSAQDERQPQWSPRRFGLFNPGDITTRTIVNRNTKDLPPSDLKLLQMMAAKSTDWEIYRAKFDLKPLASYNKLLFVEGRGDARHLVTMRENGDQRQVLNPGMPGAYFSPSWERTGGNISFVRQSGGAESLYQAEYPSTTDLNEGEGKPRWGVDTKYWRNSIKRVATLSGTDNYFAWTQNGEYLSGVREQELLMLPRVDTDVKEGRRRVQLKVTGTPLGLTWSYNGNMAILPVESGKGTRLAELPAFPPNGDVINLHDFSNDLTLKDREYILKNSFVAGGRPMKQMYHIYEGTDYEDLPIFVTSDSLLHLNHLIFDYLLRETEKNNLFPATLALSEHYLRASLQQMQSGSPEVRTAAERNAAFFTVALKLALGAVNTGKIKPEELAANDPLGSDLAALRAKTIKQENASLAQLTASTAALLKTVPPSVNQAALAELQLITQHTGMGESPIFGGKLSGVGQPTEPLLDTRIDYSDFIPRGHYTRSEILRRYFLSSRWLAAGPFRRSTAGTRQALLIVSATDANTRTRLDKVLNVVSTFVGDADDADIPSYSRLAQQEFGGLPTAAQLADEGRIQSFLKRVEQLPEPKIAPSRGPAFRVFPQLYTPDAETMQSLIYDRKAPDVGTEEVPRYFALGLDVMGVLGSDRARQILDNTQFQGTFFNFGLKETEYANYDTQFQVERAHYAGWTAADWNRNLYTRTLNALRPLLKPAPKAQYRFTKSQAWVDKNLNAALATWAELKHDTMPKQPVAIEAGSEGGITEAPLFEEPRGFVEPAPEVYARLAALVDAERATLASAGYLTADMRQRIDTFAALIQMVRNLEAKQSKGQVFTPREVEQLRFYGAYQEHLTLVTSEGEGGSMEGNDMAIIADVASAFSTRLNKLLALEEGVGRALPIYVAVERNGRRELACGAVFTYYEFTHPAEDRLTDEKWRDLLSGDKAPKLPEWTSSFVSRIEN